MQTDMIDLTSRGNFLMLAPLVPDVVEAILDGRQPADLGGRGLREGFPMEWGKQRNSYIGL